MKRFFSVLIPCLLLAGCAASSASHPRDDAAYELMFTVPRDAASWPEFASDCHDAFVANREALLDAWQETDEALAEALYYVNVVGRLWAYGNRYSPTRTGCVENNEDRSFVRIEPEFADYMESKIGCCTDHAKAMTEILAANGFECRKRMGAGHVWAEALIGDSWWTLDPTMMFAAKTRMPGDWTALRMIVFAHPGENPHDWRYRPIVKSMRESWLGEVIRKEVDPA